MNIYLSFSDGAKFADIARNLVRGLGYVSSFSFWSQNLSLRVINGLFSGFAIQPVMPYSIAIFFKLFGISDLSVVAASFFYFILAILFVFLLAKRIFKDNLIASLASAAVASNYALINYATSGASESPFIFEIVAASFFVSIRKKWATIVAFLFLVLLYFTRSQAFIYIAGEILFYLLTRFKIKKAIITFLVIMVVALLFDRYHLSKLNGNGFFYSVTTRGIQAVNRYDNPDDSVSNALRGGIVSVSTNGQKASDTAPILNIVKKVFYSLYNFYKLMPQIMNPYLFALFVIGIFKWTKNRLYNAFKASTIFVVIITLLVTALSIPFFRYIHPVIPLVYMFAVETLVWIVGKIYVKRRIIILVSTFLIFFLAAGPTLGIILLDSRFEKDTHNVDKPPVYAALSYVLKNNTNKGDYILTNLDTWGSWYGERKTVWFPIQPSQIINPKNKETPFDAIYLTSYLIDDENYYMGSDWRQIFNNPSDPEKWTCKGCAEIAKEFKLKGVYTVTADQDYERQDAKGVLLVRK